MTTTSKARQVVVQKLARRRLLVQAVIDAGAWMIALGVATLLRYDFDPALINWLGVAMMFPLAIEAQFISGYAFGLYRGRWRFGSFDEVEALVKAVLLTTALVYLFNSILVTERSIPLSSAIAAGPMALVLMAGAR